MDFTQAHFTKFISIECGDRNVHDGDGHSGRVSLSFLGLGVPPDVPTWGGILAEGRSSVLVSGGWPFSQASEIFVTVLGLNLIGDWLRDELDPKPQLNLI